MQKKKGISLIVLVITIIVMIILASTVILSISNNNVVDKAKDAVNDTNYKQVQELAQVAWAEGYVTGKRTQSDLETYVKESLISSGISQAELDKYTLTVTTTGVTVTKGGNSLDPEVQGIWKVYNLYEAIDSELYYTSSFIKIESTYRHCTLKEYKEKYMLKALITVLEDAYSLEINLSDSVTLDDFVLVMLEVPTMDDALEMMKGDDGTTLTRDELVYLNLFEFESTDEDEALEDMGYVVADIEAEYNNWVQATLPTEYANKTYTITMPDGTTETVLGSDLDSYVGRYGITENGSYEIKISDGLVTEAFAVNIAECVPETYEDEYYTYSLMSPITTLSIGYSAIVKDKTLSKYEMALEKVEAAPVIHVSYQSCTNLTEAPTLPSGVIYMNNTFRDCSNLTETPVIPESVIWLLYTFSGCTSLTTAPIIPDGVTDMTNAFYSCRNLTEAPIIPEGVTNMYGTFWACRGLTKAPAIPDSVTDLSYTFNDCTNITEAPVIPNSVTDMTSTFWNCVNLAEAPVIPDGVTDMRSTFERCTNLTKAPEIPNGVTDMGYTFAYCTNLTTAPEIPNGVTDMVGTFEYCKKITEAPIIPNSVTYMRGTFRGCENLTEAPVISTYVTDLLQTFYGCNKLEGTLQINSTNLTDYDGVLSYTGTSGSGLTVVVPNDTVRELLIQNSGYDSTYVAIVKELAQ